MKNILTLCPDGCACLSSINDGTNRIFVEVITGNNENPMLTLGSDDYLLEKNTINTFEFPSNNWPQSGGNILIGYSDATTTGSAIILTFENVDEAKNMIMKETSTHNYTFGCAAEEKSVEHPVIYNHNFSATPNSEKAAMQEIFDSLPVGSVCGKLYAPYMGNIHYTGTKIDANNGLFLLTSSYRITSVTNSNGTWSYMYYTGESQ